MTNEEPKVKATSRYSTRETCTILGISRSTLIRKTTQGFIKPLRYKGGKQNYYTGLQITKFWHQII